MTDTEKYEACVKAFEPLAQLTVNMPRASQAESVDLHRVDMRLTVGRRVRSGVWVGGSWQPMALGIIMATHDGYCDVDIMGLHGGAPWVVQYTNGSLREEPHIEKMSHCEPEAAHGSQKNQTK